MTMILTIPICLVAIAGVYLLRREMLAIGQTVGRGIREFKALLREIDDDLWRR